VPSGPITSPDPVGTAPGGAACEDDGAVTGAAPGRDPGRRTAHAVAQEQAENFPVALRVLPARLRADLQAVYDVLRLVDDLGDEAPGDRTAQLRACSAELADLWRGAPVHTPALVRLAPTVRDRGLSEEPFQRLVQANLQDQVVTRYADLDALLGYCDLSAAPVGRIVLELFGSSTPERVALSDRVCTGLQLLEHWQDLAEDRRAGRVYLPQDALAAAGVPETDLDAATTSPRLATLVLRQVALAEELLSAGPPLVRELRGWARVAVAGYVAGGLATADALRRAGGNVLSGTPRPRRRDVARHAAALLIGARR
jgi:squalene synthase HpnC